MLSYLLGNLTLGFGAADPGCPGFIAHRRIQWQACGLKIWTQADEIMFVV
jgi:hypothetical protein